ncbi:hypothetical protein AMECASPLE_026805 [Ameca splendens]|uniref:Uncharacterized protein n=1 Tax=Ameca splendens TaxID=208324 RepID=A0ABV0YS14_9TELE
MSPWTTLVKLVVGANSKSVTWNTLKHIKNSLLKFKTSIRIEKKGDLSDFERVIVVGATGAGVDISETVYLRGFSHTTLCLWFKENDPRKRKCPGSDRCVE